jgi:hypothetical protein
MEDNQNDSIREAHFKEQIEAAAMQASVVHTSTMDAMDGLGYETVDKSRTKSEILKSYLLEEWTWLTSLEKKIENDEDVPAPEHCEHIDPMNPTIWVGMLAKPNTLLCMECAMDAGTKDVESGKELCDRCRLPNLSGEFYEFVMPIVNIQLMGSICKDCLDKV